jgi:hypothetical protein
VPDQAAVLQQFVPIISSNKPALVRIHVARILDVTQTEGTEDPVRGGPMARQTLGRLLRTLETKDQALKAAELAKLLRVTPSTHSQNGNWGKDSFVSRGLRQCVSSPVPGRDVVPSEDARFCGHSQRRDCNFQGKLSFDRNNGDFP